MAEEKKGGSSPFHKDFHQEVLYFVLPGLIILGFLVERFIAYLNSLNLYGATTLWEKFLVWLGEFWSAWTVFATVLTGAAIVWGVYSFLKLKAIGKEEEKIFGPTVDEAVVLEAGSSQKRPDQWQKILAHTHSENSAEWRVAIIEADIMLDEILTAAGYLGEGVGEKLKSVEPSDLLTLDAAWEAHKVRNRIAHAGKDFELNQRETKRIISLFESVFREFGAI